MAPETSTAPDGHTDAQRLSTNARRFVAIALVNQVGSGAFAGVLVLFFVRYLDFDANTASTLLSLAAGVGLASLVPMGVVADRVGAIRLMRAASAAAFVAAAALAFVNGPAAACGCYIVLVLCDRAFNVARNGLLPTLVSGPQAVTFKAKVRAMSNLGYGLGAAIGAGILIALPITGFVVALLLNALSYAACSVLGQRLSQASEGPRPQMARKPGADRRYLCFVAVNGTLTLYMPVFELMLPILIVTRFGGPSWIPGLCLALSTAAVAVGQIKAAGGITDWVSSVRAARVGAVVAVAGLALMATGAAGSGYWVTIASIAGTLVYVVGEMRGVAGQWELQMGFAPRDRQGRYQATNAVGQGAARMLAPWLVALMSASVWWGFSALAAIYVTAVAALGPVARWVSADRGQIKGIAPEFGG